MKRITAQEYCLLISVVITNAPNKDYWITKKVKRMKEQEESDSDLSDHGCFGGYGPQVSPVKKTIRYEVEEDEYVLDVAKLLVHNGYEPAIFPIVFSYKQISFERCLDQFTRNEFNDELLADLIWCLNDNKLEINTFKRIIEVMPPEYKIKLYQANIHDDYKSIIYSHYPHCDPTRKLILEIEEKFQVASWNKFTKDAALKEKYDALNELELYLYSVRKKLEDSKFNEFFEKVIKKKRELAETALDKYQFELAVKIYSQFIKEVDNKEVKKYYHFRRGITYYWHTKYQEAMEDFKICEIHPPNDVEHLVYRGLTHVALGNYSKAAFSFQKLNFYEDLEYLKGCRKHIIQALNTEQFEKLIAIFAEKKKYNEEYKTFVTIAAEENNPVALYRLYLLAKQQDPEFADFWIYLTKAAEQGHVVSQHILAQYFIDMSQGQDKLSEASLKYNFKQAKSWIEKSAVAGYEPTKEILHDYHSKVAASFKSKTPITTSPQKRKAFEEAAKEHKPESEDPPLKLARNERADMDLFLNSKKIIKRVRIPDTTSQMESVVEDAYTNDKDYKKRNYLAANLTLIFSDPVPAGERTKRYVRTIAISKENAKKIINIEDLYPSNTQQQSDKIKETLNRDHKRAIDSSAGIYATLRNNNLEQLELLNFIPTTLKNIHNSHKYKDSENTLYDYLSREENLKRIITEFIELHKDVFKSGAKVYGVVLDIYTIYSSCTNCKKLTLVMQNKDIILKILQKILHEKGFVCLNKRHPGLWEGSKLYFQVRIRAGRDMKNKSDLIADQNLLPKRKDIKALNNSLFFHKIEKSFTTNTLSENNYLIFASGTHAKRAV